MGNLGTIRFLMVSYVFYSLLYIYLLSDLNSSLKLPINDAGTTTLFSLPTKAKRPYLLITRQLTKSKYKLNSYDDKIKQDGKQDIRTLFNCKNFERIPHYLKKDLLFFTNDGKNLLDNNDPPSYS
jgi:hypothetical protein